MDPVSAVVSGLSLTVITIVSVIALLNHERMRRNLNNQVKEVVDQINDTQYYAYKFDVKQEDNLKHFDSKAELTYQGTVCSGDTTDIGGSDLNCWFL